MLYYLGIHFQKVANIQHSIFKSYKRNTQKIQVQCKDISMSTSESRAAKLRLLNFLSLFRDLQKPTRFSGRGGSSRIFP